MIPSRHINGGFRNTAFLLPLYGDYIHKIYKPTAIHQRYGERPIPNRTYA